MVGILISIVSMAIIAGSAKAIMDTLQFHYHSSVFNRTGWAKYWNPQHSWRNKYKDTDWLEPKFPLSTTVLVWTTDAWHLFQMIRLTATSVALGFALLSEWSVYEAVGIVIAYRLVYGGVFTLLYKRMLLRSGLNR